jgi:hypothetical protein
MIAYCGLDCSKCDALIATERDDNAMRARIAEQWSKEYGASIPPDSINCTGCRAEGVKLNYCENMCEIRKCALPRKLATCADCPEYACEKLGGFFKMAPAAKENLESLRSKRPGASS